VTESGSDAALSVCVAIDGAFCYNSVTLKLNDLRNLSGKATSFRLQTSTDWFYPDFVCKLKDGRILVVEYKGKDRFDSADSEEKRAVGAVWAARSGGRCLFAMPTDRDFTGITSLVRS